MIELVFVKNMAQPREDDIELEVDAKRGKPKSIKVRGRTNISNTVNDKYLWSAIDPDDWFIDGRFQPDQGRAVVIRKDQCSPATNHRSVQVNLDGTQQGAGNITLTVRYVASQTLGSCVLGTNLILVGSHSLNACSGRRARLQSHRKPRDRARPRYGRGPIDPDQPEWRAPVGNVPEQVQEPLHHRGHRAALPRRDELQPGLATTIAEARPGA